MTDFTDEELALDPNFADRFQQGFRPACQLYLISPPAIEADFVERLARAFDGGRVDAFQLRLKGLDEDAIAMAADPIQKLCAERDVAFIINDSVALAQRLGADGVHLGQEDGSAKEARKLLGPKVQIGVTCHDSRHLAMEAGEAGADYVAFGAFYPTTTKETRHRADPSILGWWTALFSPLDPPNQWTLSNYSTVMASDGMGNAFINSLIVTLPSTVIPITIAAFAAYAFAWVPFRGRGILFIIVVGLLVVPIQMSLIPILQIYSAGNLYGSFLGIWLAHTGFGLPLAIFLLYNFMSQLPRDLFESAAIDGASHLQSFIRIVLPLSIPALGAFAIFQFLWVWNDLLVALVFLGPGADVRVLPTALYNLIGSRGGSWHLLTAGAFITMIVPLIVFLLLQRAFVRGILAGSVKQ